MADARLDRWIDRTHALVSQQYAPAPLSTASVLDADGNSGEGIRDDQWYHFHPELGLVAGSVAADPARTAFSGSDLLAMARGEFDGPARPAARRLLRQALAVHLGEAPLKSRELFRRGRGEASGNRAVEKP